MLLGIRPCLQIHGSAPGERGVSEGYALIRKALICRWLRLPLPPESASIDHLIEAVADLAPRVPPADAGAAPDLPTVPLAS